MAYLETKDLTVGYHGKPLIKDIALHVQRGKIVTLIGPNGSGKSTILKTIIGQLSKVSGTVFLDGKAMEERSRNEIARRMAILMTARMEPELMTCHDIVATGRYPYTGRLGLLSDEDRAKVDEALALVGADELADRDFSCISDGQRQRVLLARAICQEPEILILDEPTSFLDVKHKLELLAILEKMAREKKMTVIMSLHEIDLAQKVSDKIVCVQGENISHFGKPEEVFQEEIIRDLYGITNGSFDPRFGSIELPGIKGEPEVLVISSGGSGIPVYRKLRKERIPFAAGILYENDIDCELARQLAVEVITEKAFEEISDETFASAEKMIERCGRVIDAGVQIGTYNRRIGELLEQAERLGKLERAGTLK